MRKVFLERNYENINKCIFPGKGIYGIPEIKRETYQGCEWIGFNYVAILRGPFISLARPKTNYTDMT